MTLFSEHGLEQRDIRTIPSTDGEKNPAPAPVQTQADTPIFASSAAHSIPLYRRRSVSNTVESPNPSSSQSRYDSFRLSMSNIYLLTHLNRESEHVSPSQRDQANTATRQESAGDLTMSDAMEEDDAGVQPSSEAEPYMTAGYESLAAEQAHSSTSLSPRQTRTPPPEPTTGLPYAPSRDPIYNPAGWWELGGVKPLEFQYGAFEQMRQFAEATVMNF